MSDTHAQSVAFVRKTEIPPAPPPVTETGAIKWVRENLFSGWFNTIATLVGLYVVFWLLSGVIPWILNGTWEGSSIRDCREIIAGTGGGCFAVLAERWNQLLFGFEYPSELYWRPTLAFLLLFVAVPQVLFINLPRKLLILTALYPFVAYWLIWGGSILVPTIALLGLVGGYMAFHRAERINFAAGLGAGVATAIVVWWLGGFVTAAMPNLLALEPVESRNMGGFMLNLILGLVCVSLSLPLGIVLALGRQSRMPLIKYVCVVFIESCWPISCRRGRIST